MAAGGGAGCEEAGAGCRAGPLNPRPGHTLSVCLSVCLWPRAALSSSNTSPPLLGSLPLRWIAPTATPFCVTFRRAWLWALQALGMRLCKLHSPHHHLMRQPLPTAGMLASLPSNLLQHRPPLFPCATGDVAVALQGLREQAAAANSQLQQLARPSCPAGRCEAVSLFSVSHSVYFWTSINLLLGVHLCSCDAQCKEH